MHRKTTIITLIICLAASGLIYQRYLAEPGRRTADSGQSAGISTVEQPASGSGAERLSRVIGASASSAADVEKGASLYATHCASCHGVDLEGEPNWQSPHADGRMKAPPHDDTGHTWHHDDHMLYEYTRIGGQALMKQAGIDNFKSGMPAFGDVLTDAQIVQVFDFIKSRWSKKNRRIQRERSGK